MFLKNQLAKGRPVVLPIEIKTFQCMNTIQIRINLFVKFFTLSITGRILFYPYLAVEEVSNYKLLLDNSF